MVSRAYTIAHPSKKKPASKGRGSGRTPTTPKGSKLARAMPSGTSISPYRMGTNQPIVAPKVKNSLATLFQPPGTQNPGSRSMGAMMGGGGRGGGRSYGYGGGGYGGGGGGGGPAGPSAAQLAAVDKAFTLDESPYWHMQAAFDNQRRQANAYNPNFGAMEQQALAGGRTIEADRNSMVQARLNELAQLGQTLATQQGQAIGAATRDLASQGFNPNQYVEQANTMGAERVGQMTNLGSYLTMLNQQAAGQNADWQRGLGMIRQGGEAALANSKIAANNQLDMQSAQLQQQAMQGRLANQQAKLQFMLQNGLIL